YRAPLCLCGYYSRGVVLKIITKPKTLAAQFLEIPPHSELENAALNHTGWLPPGSAVDAGVGCGFSEDCIGVERVVNIEVRVQCSPLLNLKDLAEAQIHLVKAVAKRRVGIENIDGLAAASTDAAAESR